jgi:protein-L-isoaspartate(D-aspartate) O-methyltransferase
MMVREQIRARGVLDPKVLDAVERVPRERFVPGVTRDEACRDSALGIGHGQTISQPYIVAAMTEALQIEPGHRVLDVGTGSGYQAAVLAEMGAEVFTVERVPELAETAGDLLAELGYEDVQVREGDGSLGWPEEAPFDRIVVGAGAPELPPALLEQLSPDGGRLVAPVGGRERQELTRVVREGTEFQSESLMGCRFVPLLGEEGW